MTSTFEPGSAAWEFFRGAPTSIISDNLSRMPGCVGLRPFHRKGQLVGRALTVRTRAGDNLAIHQALELIKPGDVVVVDGEADETRALVGEIMLTIARHRGATGFVIDGAIRDAGAIAAGDWPVYARTAIHRGPYKNGPGEINVPVAVGGCVIAPGDVIVGDEDGVVSFAPALIADLMPKVQAQIEREAETIKSIVEGRYKGSYAAAKA